MLSLVDKFYQPVEAKRKADESGVAKCDKYRFYTSEEDPAAEPEVPRCAATLAELIANLENPNSIHARQFAQALRVFTESNVSWFSAKRDDAAEKLREISVRIGRENNGRSYEKLPTETQNTYREVYVAAKELVERMSQLAEDSQKRLRALNPPNAPQTRNQDDGADGEEQLRVRLVQALRSLDNLIGLEQVKQFFTSRIEYYIFFPRDRDAERHLNIALLGAPGTGKTTVARILNDIYAALGLLASLERRAVSFDKSDLTASFEGQTARKTKSALLSILGRTGFLDEAYNLGTGSDDGKGYGREAIDQIVKLTDDWRGRLVFIVAGYEDSMDELFFAENEGLRSRFPDKLVLENFGADQLFDIVVQNVEAKRWTISGEAQDALRCILEEAVSADYFADSNARGATQLAEELRQARACAVTDRIRQAEAEQRLINVDFISERTISVDEVKRAWVQWCAATQTGPQKDVFFRESVARSRRS